MRSAAIGTAVWVAIGLAFAFVILATLGGSATGQYLTGYVIEESLSVDNVFVWAVIFTFFAVPTAYHRRALFWGIFGALVFRAIFIFAGVALLTRFSWIELVFGAFLVLTAYRIAFHDETEIDPERNPIFRVARRLVPVTDGYRGQHMFVREGGKRYATPLFLVLIFVELTDVVFAVDSVPAVLAVSRSQFIVFTSNAFAILGLRAIYFLLAGAKDALVHLNVGLGVILAFVGVKMIVSRWLHVNTFLSLAVIVAILTITVIASLRTNARARKVQEPS
jgi:tellurite resistance protein TerC